ncbi:hypothetical protein AGDE_15988 [Angomonas deanei]|nr:hypothetical protein AGDE_15988 [Angomonas deanei]|eukprot:EPY17970.1 hypothetical protein AGDE_15988 [Angomonas deanei]
MNSECEVDIRKAFECIDLGENVPMAANELSPCPPRSDEGMLLFSEMTDIFAKYEGYRDLVIGKLIDILDDTESGLDISFLDRLFNPVTLSDSDAASALGSATRGFHVLAGVMWSCATFEYQCSIVRQVRQWRVAVGSDSWHKTACPGSKHVHVILNLGNAVSTIRGFFEGSNAGQSNGAPCVCPNSSGLPLANSLATLLRSQGHTQEKGAAEVKNVGARTVLYNITSGMLMYVQFYLSIRSLSAARRCARMAIQVSGQLQADEIIALSHYTYFNVNLCGGLVSEAADSISIALQISTSRKRNGEANICSLCYFGAAHLLLLHPSAAGAPLRTLLTGSVSSKIPASKQQKTSELSEMSTAPLIAVEQNTSQTVRQAIYSSEREAGALKGPELWTEVCLSVSRKTLLLIGSIYGMVCVPLNLDEHTISRLAIVFVTSEGELPFTG